MGSRKKQAGASPVPEHDSGQGESRQDHSPKAEEPSSSDQAYLDERKLLLEGEEAYASRFDKWLITLSGGALALSLAFLKDFVPSNGLRAECCLFFAWVLFTLVIVVTLGCTLLCQRAREKYREALDKAYENGGCEWQLRARNAQGERCEPKLVAYLNRLNIVLFPVGLVFLAVFAVSNVATTKERRHEVSSFHRSGEEGREAPESAGAPTAEAGARATATDTGETADTAAKETEVAP
jgi:hypothetical protein